MWQVFISISVLPLLDTRWLSDLGIVNSRIFIWRNCIPISRGYCKNYSAYPKKSSLNRVWDSICQMTSGWHREPTTMFFQWQKKPILPGCLNSDTQCKCWMWIPFSLFLGVCCSWLLAPTLSLTPYVTAGELKFLPVWSHLPVSVILWKQIQDIS